MMTWTSRASGTLASMMQGGGAQLKKWEKVVGTYCEARIKSWVDDERLEQVKTYELLDVLLIAPQLPSFYATFLPLLADLASSLSNTPSNRARSDFLHSPASKAQALAATLLAFSRVASCCHSVPELIQTQLEKLVIPTIESFSWHRGVMESVAELGLSEKALESTSELRQKVYNAILPNLLSEDSVLRRSSVKIAISLFKAKDGHSVAASLLAMCLEVEDMPLSVQGAREKSMKVRKLGIVSYGQLGKLGEPVEQPLEIVVHYLTAMLKVNFKPIWPEAIQALSLLSEKYPDNVWKITCRQLVIAATHDDDLFVSRKPMWASTLGPAEDDAVFEEQHLRCFHLEESQRNVRKALLSFSGGLEAQEERNSSLILDQIAPERLVVASYEAQLLALFCAVPNLAQKNSRDFTETFLGCFQRDDHYGSQVEEEVESLPSFVQPNESTKEKKLRLLAWLTLYAKFPNQKALYRADELSSLFHMLLAFPDPEVQKLALECILKRKSSSLTANAERLRRLLDPTLLREELLQFVSDPDAGGLDPADRSEVVPLLIRISYGIMISRQGRASASSGQGRAGRRAAILGALKTCSSDELNTLVDLAVGPIRQYLVTPPEGVFCFSSRAPKITGKRQLGFLGFLADLLKHLGKEVVARWPDLVGATLSLLHFAQKGIESADMEDEEEEEEDLEKNGEDAVAEDGDSTRLAPLRHIRQLALRRFADFCRLEAGFDLSPYIAAAFPSIISPRLPQLAAENAQSPSSLLELFVTWASRRDLVDNLVQYDSTLLPSLYGCLTVRNVKPAVILRVFDMIDSCLEFAAEEGGKDSHVGQVVIQPGVDILLEKLAGLFEINALAIDARHEVGQRQVVLLCSLAPYIVSRDQATTFLTLVTPMLRKTNKTIPEKTKTDLLKIVEALYPLALPSPQEPLYAKCYETLSALFSSIRTRTARLQLVSAFVTFTDATPELATCGRLVNDLNSFSTKRSEEPDFERRLEAFSLLNENIYTTISAQEWLPVIQNMLFFIQDTEELAIRSNASFTLRRFVEVAGSSENSNIRTILIRTLLPGLRNTLHSKFELVRAEVLGVYASAVERCSGIAELDQLKCLLVDGDQEANFFYNIVHIQIHRRTRALRRLADEIEAGNISSKVVSEVFIPLLDIFIMGADEKKDPDLVNETVQCLGRLSKHLVWSSYFKLVLHYLKFAKAAGSAQKACARSLVAVLKGFHFDLETDVRLLEIATGRLLPDLLSYIEKREANDEEIRIPVAEGISAIVQHLPGDGREAQEATLLMALAQILRSHDQHIRDLTRLTICNIAVSAGLAALPTIVKELRRALQRGPQLHVLAFTVHAVLVRLAVDPTNVDFDGSLHELVPVLSDDVFGTPSKDRGSEEFRAKTKFREVRSYKSLDSFQLLAQTISPTKISTLLSPVRDVLQRTESAKTMKEVDEVFKRITLGLVVNPRLTPLALLDLAHTLISQNAAFLRPARTAVKVRKAAADYHVQLERTVADERDFFAKNAHKFVSFGLELFNSAFRKSVFDLDSPEMLGHLEPLVNLVGNTLYSEDPTVLARSMRATASLIRCPLSNVGKAAPILVKQMLEIVHRSGSTESELAQSALRTLSIVIRDIKSATLREDQLTELLQLIGPDLEEADRQATLFQLLRAIMSRNFVAPEIYDIMDRIAEILVTNQSSNIREVCRAVYLQFLLDYPQGRGRLQKSLAFLAKNLEFVHESGRLSVLELMSAVVTKFSPQLLRESAELFFVGLVMVVANDESTRCREMAAEVIKALVSRLEKDVQDALLLMLYSWASKLEQQQLARTAVQLFGTVIEALGPDGKLAAPKMLAVLTVVLTRSEEALQEAEEQGEQAIELDSDWQLPYQALQSLAHIYRAFPDLVSPDAASNHDLWDAVRGHLLFPHVWLRTSSARLLGSLYANHSLSTSVKTFNDPHLLSTSKLLDAAQKGCLQLKSPHLSEGLAIQVVKNLFFAARCFEARRTGDVREGGDVDEEEENEGDEEKSADPLRWLFTRLSYQARAAHTSRPSMHAVTTGQWSLQPASVLRWFAAVINSLEAKTLSLFLVQMATPIFRISEDPNAQDPQMAELQSLAHEVQELLQAKIGTTAYSAVHTVIRQKAASRRNERKTALALQAINDPAELAKRKVKRNEQKLKQKKRKNAAFADQKERFGIGHTKKQRRD